MWPTATSARIGLDLRIEWDRVKPGYPKVAPVAIVGYALAQALAKNPLANRRVAVWRIRQNPNVRISFVVDVHDNLRIAVVNDADSLDPRGFQRSLLKATRDARASKGPIATASRIVEAFPGGLGRIGLRMWAAVNSGLGIGLFGIDGAPFWCRARSRQSSVSGYRRSMFRFCPSLAAAMICSVGAVAPAVIVRDGQPVVADVVEVKVSYDHRVCDGAQLAHLLEDFLRNCYEPPSAIH